MNDTYLNLKDTRSGLLDELLNFRTNLFINDDKLINTFFKHELYLHAPWCLCGESNINYIFGMTQNMEDWTTQFVFNPLSWLIYVELLRPVLISCHYQMRNMWVVDMVSLPYKQVCNQVGIWMIFWWFKEKNERWLLCILTRPNM